MRRHEESNQARFSLSAFEGEGRGGEVFVVMLWLQLRNELWKLFGKQRTYIGSGMFFLAQTIGILLFQFGQGPYRQLVGDIENLGFSADRFLTNLTIASFLLVPIGYMLLPLYVS